MNLHPDSGVSAVSGYVVGQANQIIGVCQSDNGELPSCRQLASLMQSWWFSRTNYFAVSLE